MFIINYTMHGEMVNLQTIKFIKTPLLQIIITFSIKNYVQRMSNLIAECVA